MRETVRTLQRRLALGGGTGDSDHGAAANGHESGAEFTAALLAGNDFGPETRSSVRVRLRARLVDRRCRELVAAWQRKHGSSWASYMLSEDFHTHEELHRICEALSLRPDLERQVVAAARERARSGAGVLDDDNDAPAEADCNDSSMFSSFADDGGQRERGTRQGLDLHRDALSSDSWSPRRAGETSGEAVAASDGAIHLAPESDIAWSPTPSQQTTPRESPAPSPHHGPLAEPRVADELFWTFEVEPEHSGNDAGGEEEEDVETEPDQASIAPSKNWSEATTSSGSEAFHCSRRLPRQSCSGKPQRTALQTAKTPASKEGRARCRVHFASSSAVRFWKAPCPEEEGAKEASSSSSTSVDGEGQYERSLATKAFDGPSGHKARRATRAGERSSDDDDDDSEAEESDCEEDDWTDTCDDIANLMSQPRHMLMWSATWA